MIFKRLIIASFVFVVGLNSTPALAEEPIAASINGEKIPMNLLNKGNELDIFEAEKTLYNLRMNNLRSLLISKLIKLDPKSKGLDEDAYISQYVAKPIPVNDQMVDTFIRQRQYPANKINTNLKEQVRRFLTSQQISQQVDWWFQAQQAKHQIEIKLSAPVEPRFEVDISKAAYRGNKNAPVTIVEFSDFQCPYCTRVNTTLSQLTDEYGDKVQVVFKHFPLSSIHPEAIKAAEASECAQEQGMNEFWLLHDKMFSQQRSLSVGLIKDMAKELGLESEKFNQCLMSEKYAQRVADDTKEALSLGVKSTPAFFINGRFLNGAQPFEIFKNIIDEELVK